MALPHGGKGGGKAGARAAAGKRPDPGDSPSGDESGERSDHENMLWTKDTDLVLRDLVLRSGEVNWARIATAIEWDAGTVTARECEDRWQEVKETPVKGPWSSEEDDHLKRLVEEYGAKKWNLLARAFPGRSGKQCRERWHNHVDERVKKGEWTAEEDQILCEAQRQLGNKWSEMSRILEGRSENAIKNRFNSLNAKGLTETRANELMSKLAPEEAAAFLVKGAPVSEELDFSRGLGRQGEEDDDGSGGDGDDDNDDDDDDDDDGDPDRGGGGGGGGGDGGRFVPSSGGGFSSSAGGGGARGGGGSGSLEALMVAARDERVACIINYGGERDEEDDVWGRGGGGGRGRGTGGGGGGRGGRGGGRRGWSPARGDDGREWGKKATRRDVGGRDGRSGVEGEKRGVKRERGACEKMDIYRRKARELVRRGSEMSGAEAGMSVLAQAAGLLDIEDAVEEDGNLSGSHSDSSSNGAFYHDGGGSSAGAGSRSTTSRGGGGGGGGCSGFGGGSSSSCSSGSGVFRNSHCHNNDSAVDYQYHQPSSMAHQSHRRHGGGIDHGSTPPGSASPLPSAAASGGGATVGDAACSGDGSSGSGGGGTTGTPASAFAVGAGETVSTSGAAERTNSGFYGASFGGGGGRCGGGGLSSYGGEGAGGGGKVTPQWGSGSSRPASPPRSGSGWFVGPGGMHRRSLGSVPGPWRPYWKGEDCTEKGDGVMAAAVEGGGKGVAASRFELQEPEGVSSPS